MAVLLVVGLLAGMITSISPCVLPVLPVILASGLDGSSRSRWRPYGVVIGLVVAFTLATLFGSLVLSALHLPLWLLRDAGVAVLVVIGLGLLWPRLGQWLERPFARLPGWRVRPESNGLLLGLGLGLLFVPCAGPVLAAIAVVGATHRVGLDALVLASAFGVGAGVPLLVLALAGSALSRKVAAVRAHASRLRSVGGVVMILMAVVIGLNLTDGLQRQVPGYTNALQNAVEGSPAVTGRLRELAAPPDTGSAATSDVAGCTVGGDDLVKCGPAPELAGINGWLNTPGGAPLSLAALRGKVVLIDFWTYSCINCQRTLPHLRAWDQAYRDHGLVIIGVHTPEFAFEHDPANIAAQSAALGVHYPVAIDNDYATWNAYENQYWPAEYLVDPSGVVRHESFGEGEYGTTEELIRQLLAERSPETQLPPATEIPDATPSGAGQTPETYLGYQYAPLHVSGPAPTPGRPADYRFPATVDPDTFALSGSWTSGAEALTSGPNGGLEINYQANRVYLVLGGEGSVTVRSGGGRTSVLDVSGVPKLYQLPTNGDSRSTLVLSFTPGVQAYDFTFG
jgi:cytochrome c biogenesis protein CcdA/thiol-disulfide isomerase/thioredoxin